MKAPFFMLIFGNTERDDRRRGRYVANIRTDRWRDGSIPSKIHKCAGRQPVGRVVTGHRPLMPTYIALLRGINVGGHNKIAMADLRDFIAKLGFTGPKTLLQSGNLVFTGGRKSDKALETLLEQETAKRLGVAADYMIRNTAALEAVVAANPFPKEAKSDPSHLVVVFLKSAVTAKDVKALGELIKGPEVVRGEGTHLYIVYPAGIGTSKFTAALIEKKLGTRGTARNWNTVLKLLALASGEKA
jgi:uncharacterized protein (DUF1697 family)